MIENYNNSSRYNKKSSYTKVLNFHELMDYIYLKVEDGFDVESYTESESI